MHTCKKCLASLFADRVTAEMYMNNGGLAGRCTLTMTKSAIASLAPSVEDSILRDSSTVTTASSNVDYTLSYQTWYEDRSVP